MPIRQITIVGTGLIGGSLGLALRQAGFSGTIVGCDKPEVVDAAITRGAIDRGGSDPREAALESDVVVLATPVGAILSLFERAGAYPGSGHAAHRYRQHQRAGGGTRARGAGRSGAENASCRAIPWPARSMVGLRHADANLFRDAVWLITPITPDQPYTPRQQEYLGLLQLDRRTRDLHWSRSGTTDCAPGSAICRR